MSKLSSNDHLELHYIDTQIVYWVEELFKACMSPLECWYIGCYYSVAYTSIPGW